MNHCVCFFCDASILDKLTMTTTTHGAPICAPCRAGIETHLTARRLRDIESLFRIGDPRESRSSGLIRQPPVNIHQ